jgi:hypothetical protein
MPSKWGSPEGLSPFPRRREIGDYVTDRTDKTYQRVDLRGFARQSEASNARALSRMVKLRIIELRGCGLPRATALCVLCELADRGVIELKGSVGERE